MQSFHDTNVDMIKIEDQARQMRAEAVRYGVVEARKWVVAQVARLFGHNQAAA